MQNYFLCILYFFLKGTAYIYYSTKFSKSKAMAMTISDSIKEKKIYFLRVHMGGSHGPMTSQDTPLLADVAMEYLGKISRTAPPGATKIIRYR